MMRRLTALFAALVLTFSVTAVPAAPAFATGPAELPAPASLQQQKPAPTDPERNERAFFSLVVNDVHGGDVLIILRPRDVLVEADALRQIGLRVASGATVAVGTQDFVSLAALGDAVSYVVDETALKLTVTVAPSMFEAQKLKLGSDAREFAPSIASGGGFLNYSLQTASTGRRFSANGQLGVALGAGVFEVTLTQDPQLGSTQHLSNAAYTIDNVAQGRRYVLGTSSVDANDFAGLGGSAILMGLSVRHDATLNPHFARRYGDGFSGIATTPSTVEVYVNGSLIRQEAIGPGPFAITNIPLQNGVNHTSVVVRDALGNVQRIERPEYIGVDLLARGQRDYDFGVGHVVAGNGNSSRLAAGRYEVGVSNNVTMSARGSLDAHTANVGVGLGLGTPFGEFGLLAAASRARASAGTDVSLIDLGVPSNADSIFPTGIPIAAGNSRVAGSAFALTYGFMSSRYNVVASMVRQSDHYASLSLAPSQDRVISNDRVVARYQPRQAGGMQLAADLERVAYRDAPTVKQFQAQVSRSLGRGTSVFVGLGHRAVGALSGAIWSVGMSSTFRGLRLTTSNSSSVSGHSNEIDVSKLSSSELGTSIQAQISHGDLGASTAINYERRTALGNLNLYATLGQGANGIQAVLNGAVAYAGHAWYLSRPIRDGFGVIDVGVPAIEATVNGESVGMTNRSGKLFVPSLSALYPSAIELNGATLPDNIVFENVVASAMPRYRRGAVVKFAPRTLKAVTGLLRFDDERTAGPAFGQLVLHTPAGDRVSDLGVDGQFYFEGIPAGTYESTAKYASGECTLRIAFPSGDLSYVKLGTLYCRRELK